MTELRVAVAMGGGVSLGSFCGGALGETVRQLLESRARAYDRVRFDVFSGASAGAMSLGLMLHTLAHPDHAGRPGAVLERQHEAWVRRIDIRELIPDPRMSHVSSLMDRGAVERIADDLMAWEAGTPPDDTVLGRRVLLACTLANLNGIPVDGRRAGQGEGFLDALQTTLYQDLRVFDLRLGPPGLPAGRDGWLVRDDPSRSEVWREIAATCVAAGAFPVAFEPVVLERAREEYGSLWPEAWADLPAFPFTFSDGGMFNNEPLREVMDLIGRMDAERGDFERVVIFIDPHLSGTTEDLSLDYHREIDVRDPDNTLWKLGRIFDGRDVEPRSYVERMAALAAPLVGALRGQAAFKDWLSAEKVNNRLGWRKELRDALTALLELLPPEAFEEGGPGADLTADVQARLRRVLEEKHGRSVRENPGLALTNEQLRIEREEGDRLGRLDARKRRVAVDLFSLVDQVAGLRDRRRVRVVGIGPVGDDGEPVDLAGAFVANFGGFFSEAYRAYDFEVGRERAASLLHGAGLLEKAADLPSGPPPSEVRPALGHTPESRRLLERLRTVVGHLLDVKVDWPLKLDKLAIRLARGKLGGLLESALNGDGGAATPYVVRLEIAPAAPRDRFRLAGKHGGDPLPALRAGAADGAGGAGASVIETLVRHAPATGEVEGPHVTGRNGRPVLELVRVRRLRRDERRVLALPEPALFARLERMGYGKLVAAVDWAQLEGADQVVELEWRAVEALRGLGVGGSSVE